MGALRTRHGKSGRKRLEEEREKLLPKVAERCYDDQLQRRVFPAPHA